MTAVAPAATFAPPPQPIELGTPDAGATAVAAPAQAGARPAALTLTLRYEMVCGRPGRGPLVVTLPAAARVPATIARGAVLLQGKPAVSVSVAGHKVTIGVANPTGITCHSITLGTLRATFTRSADLGNPAEAGSYPVRAQIGKRSFTAQLAIGARSR